MIKSKQVKRVLTKEPLMQAFREFFHLHGVKFEREDGTQTASTEDFWDFMRDFFTMIVAASSQGQIRLGGVFQSGFFLLNERLITNPLMDKHGVPAKLLPPMPIFKANINTAISKLMEPDDIDFDGKVADEEVVSNIMRIYGELVSKQALKFSTRRVKSHSKRADNSGTPPISTAHISSLL